MGKRIDKIKLFNSLVDNAIDFLNNSVSQLEKSPKYSVINFWSAIELFFKARLFLEHWSLVFANINDANPDKLESGRFVSSNFSETVERLKNLTGLILINDANKTFEKLRTHRNQVIHFFHSNYSDESNSDLLEDIISEQCRGWFYLHKLLTRDWAKEFTNYQEQVNEFHKSLKRRHGYLNAKFDSLKPSIKKGMDRGVKFRYCESCQFLSQSIIKLAPPFYKFNCLVCEIKGTELHQKCPGCKNEVFEIEFGEGRCNSCHYETYIEELVEIYNPETNSKDSEQYQISCGNCDNENTIIPINENYDKFGCFFCGSIYGRFDLHECFRCTATTATEDYDRLFSGCPSCQWY